MNDRQLIKFAASFREGILDGGPSDMMCAAVAWPLAALLRCNGVDCKSVESKDVPTDFGTVNHVWIRLADGRALDPTADQFGEQYPPIYLGPPIEFHGQPRVRRMTFERAAIEIMEERGETDIWFGNLSLWEDIYERRYAGDTRCALRTRNPHPMNREQAVFDAIRRSKRFERTGYIRSIGWSDRETLHPNYKLIRDRDGTPRRPEGAEAEGCQPGPRSGIAHPLPPSHRSPPSD